MTWQSWEAVFAQWRRNGATSVRLSVHSGEEMGLPQFDCLCAVEKKWATSVRLSLRSGEEMWLPQFDCLGTVEKKWGYLSSIFTENYILICLVLFSVLLL